VKNMHLPLLISKANWIKLKMFQNDYKIGYLLKDDNKCYWTTWGSCKDLESALKCVKDFIKEKGEREVYLSDIPLDKNISLEQFKTLKRLDKLQSFFLM
jgi:hypothetical protein